MNSKEWKMTLNDPWFHYVKTGEKIYEGRCYWKSVIHYKIGDTLKIVHHTHPSVYAPYVCRIDEILHFPNFGQALERLGLDCVLPNVKSIKEGTEIYHKFYKPETQDKYGIVMIKVKLLQDTSCKE